jgi:hypothetical protein
VIADGSKAGDAGGALPAALEPLVGAALAPPGVGVEPPLEHALTIITIVAEMARNRRMG